MWVYQQSEPQLWTVGFYVPTSGEWVAESDHSTPEAAAARVAFLNGRIDAGGDAQGRENVRAPQASEGRPRPRAGGEDDAAA